jgi:Legionella pneumophila major outer membrane protein precursor
MKKTMMSLVAAAMMLQGVASADLTGDLMCGHFWVAGEALLLRPSGAYPYVAFIGPYVGQAAPPEGSQLGNCPDYEWGYKIELGYRNCDKELLVNWLSWNNGYNDKFKFSDEQTAFNNIGDIAGAGTEYEEPGVIKAISCLKYDALDAEVAKWMCKECSKWSARGFFGLRYARIRNGRTVVAVGDGELEEVITGASDVQGTGPRVGLGARWNFWCDFGLTGSAAGHLLIGSAKSQHFDFTLDGEDVITFANVKNRKVCRIIPASEIKFGLDWNGCLFCGLSGELGVGYQISHYFYGSQSTLFTQSANRAATNHVHTDPVSFDGWYFRLGLMY